MRMHVCMCADAHTYVRVQIHTHMYMHIHIPACLAAHCSSFTLTGVTPRPIPAKTKNLGNNEIFLRHAAHYCLAFGAACAWFASGAIATSRRHDGAVWRVLRRVNLQQVRDTKVRAHNWGEAGQGGKRNQLFSEGED